MTWIKQTVWQLGFAILLVLAGAIVAYLAGTADVNQPLLWVGIGLAWVGLLIPLLSQFFDEDEEQESDE